MKFDDSEATLKIIIKNQLLTIDVEGFGEALKVANGMENNLSFRCSGVIPRCGLKLLKNL